MFEIGAIFHHLYGKRKKAAISSVEFYQSDRSCSYIVLALVETDIMQLGQEAQ